MIRLAQFSMICLSGWLTGSSTALADWPHFLGPNYDLKSDETGFLKATDKPLPKIWERRIGPAFSSLAIVDDRVYTCGQEDKQQWLYSLNADTGEVVWKKPIEKEFRNEHGDGTRATPTVHDGLIYVLGANGRLLCADARTGEMVWEKQFNHVPTWAYSGSVLIEGDLAIASAGESNGALVAFDRKTGKEAWKTGSDPVGYATPYPFTFENKRYVVGFTGNAALIVEPKTGREVWRTSWKTDWNVNAASPIYHDGYLFLTSGYDTGSALYKLSAGGDGLATQEVWRSDVLLNKFQSPILHEGHLYGSDQNALKCVEFLTGKEKWKKPRVRNGTLILAEGHLLLLTESGQLQIAKASPEDFKPTLTADILDGRCWSVPVLLDGRIYARNLERAVCFNLKP